MRLQILFIFMVVKHPSILDFRYPTVTRSYPFPTRFQLVLARYVKFGTTKAAQAVTILLVIGYPKIFPKTYAGWWFGTCFVFPYIRNNKPI